MKLSELIKALTQPANLRIVIILVALTVLMRNTAFLLTDGSLQLFATGAQPVIEITLGIDIPNIIMTIAWPIVLALANQINHAVKVDYDFFRVVLIIHVLTTFYAAYDLYMEHDYSFLEADMLNSSAAEIYLSTLITVPILTAIATYVSYRIYIKDRFFSDIGGSEESNQ